MELRRGNSITLSCAASANPYPALTWQTQGGEIKQGVSNTLNSSSQVPSTPYKLHMYSEKWDRI